jgi:GNAT superfamily N-acetyltransferase
VPSLPLRQLDPAAGSFGDDLERWYAAYLASVTHRREADAAPWRLPEVDSLLRTPSGHRWFGAWVAEREGEVVGAGCLDLPLSDNTSLAMLEVQVPPAHRRTGAGEALVQLLEREARERGRTLAIGDIEFGIDVPDDGAAEPGMRFAFAHGYTVGIADLQRRLTLPVDDALLDRLAAEAAPHHAAYELVSWCGDVPEELVAGYAALAAQLVVEAPTGDLELEAEDPSVAGWRDREAAWARQGLTMWHTAALSEAGDVVAHTLIGVSAYDRSLCHQWGTLVAPEHRGHRLGLAVKVANHRFLQAGGAPAAEVVTWNARVNDHMVAINEQLGFHRVGVLVEVQKHL